MRLAVVFHQTMVSTNYDQTKHPSKNAWTTKKNWRRMLKPEKLEQNLNATIVMAVDLNNRPKKEKM